MNADTIHVRVDEDGNTAEYVWDGIEREGQLARFFFEGKAPTKVLRVSVAYGEAVQVADQDGDLEWAFAGEFVEEVVEVAPEPLAGFPDVFDPLLRPALLAQVGEVIDGLDRDRFGGDGQAGAPGLIIRPGARG